MSNFSLTNNLSSSSAQSKLSGTTAKLNQTLQRLSSGLRINKSGDDAAGLAIANSYRSDISVLSQGVRNANDGLSSLQILDGGLNTISGLLDRASTLAAQSASGTFSGNRDTLQNEFSKITAEITRQAQNIGLASNPGQESRLNKSLSVFIGGGVDASGSTNTVSVDLSGTANRVDAAGLGLAALNIGATALPTSVTGFTAAAPIGANTSTNGVSATAITSTAATTKISGVDFGASGSTAIAADEQLTFTGNDGKVFSVNLTGGQNGEDIASAINGVASNNFVTASYEASTGRLSLEAKMVGTPQSFAVSSNRSANDPEQTGLNGASVSYTAANTIAADEKLTFHVDGKEFSVDLSRGDSADDIIGKINSSTGNVYGIVASKDNTGKLQLNSSLTDPNSASFTVTSNRNGSVSSSGLNNISSTFSRAAITADENLTFTVGDKSIEVALKNGDTTDVILDKINSAVGEYGIKASAGTGSNAALNTISLTVDLTNPKAADVSVASDRANAAGSTGLNGGAGAEIKITSASGGEAGAVQALDAIKSAIKQLGVVQGTVGAGQNNLNQAIDLASAQITNFQAAESAIRDADIAAEASNLARLNTLQQAGVSALAQANQSSQALLSLLR